MLRIDEAGLGFLRLRVYVCVCHTREDPSHTYMYLTRYID